MSRGNDHPRSSLYLWVALGSSLGALARWAVAEVMAGGGAPGEAAGWPWATLAVNVAGSLLIGILAALVARHRGALSQLPAQLFLMTGFCGAFTTFSAFGLETLWLLQAGRPGMAIAYVACSVPLWMCAAWAGYRLALQGWWGAAR
jgi:CrcB protein